MMKKYTLKYTRLGNMHSETVILGKGITKKMFLQSMSIYGNTVINIKRIFTNKKQNKLNSEVTA